MRDLNRYVIVRHACDWYGIGLELGLQNSNLKVISKDYKHDCEACFTSVLSKWLDLTPRATWKMLEVAMTNANRASLVLTPVVDVYMVSMLQSVLSLNYTIY